MCGCPARSRMRFFCWLCAHFIRARWLSTPTPRLKSASSLQSTMEDLVSGGLDRSRWRRPDEDCRRCLACPFRPLRSPLPGKNAPALADKDGFVDTGDMIERRGDRCYFVGRRGGIINVGGIKIYPEAVEAALNSHAIVRASRSSLARTRSRARSSAQTSFSGRDAQQTKIRSSRSFQLAGRC